MKANLESVFNFSGPSLLRPALLFLAVIALDQVSKLVVLQYQLFPIYLNYNVAFSLPIPWFLPWIIFVFLFLYYFIFSKKRDAYVSTFKHFIYTSSFELLAIIMMLGGGVSNVIDRLLYQGAVVDFIDVGWWPVFNLADSFIVIGLLLFLYCSFKSSS